LLAHLARIAGLVSALVGDLFRVGGWPLLLGLVALVVGLVLARIVRALRGLERSLERSPLRTGLFLWWLSRRRR
jgi:hypothetical protein